MPIILPEGLPACRCLRAEGLEVMGREASDARALRPLRIGLLNLMPTKAKTETQIARLLAMALQTVELVLFAPDGYRPKSTPAAHMASFYQPWSAVRARGLDGLIVTGAPVERLDFATVTYWDSLVEILDWARAAVPQSFYICWAAQAALHRFHGVPKHGLPAKMFGVYRHSLARGGTRLLRGLGDEIPVPVSRYTEVRAADLPEQAGLEVLAESSEAGLCLLEERARGAVYMFNHLEYDSETLGEEYRRDQAAGLGTALPRHYFPGDDPDRRPVNGWRGAGSLLFRNWLDGVARSAATRRGEDPALGWLFPERPALTLVGECASEFLILGDDDPNRLPEALRRLADLGLSPLKAQVYRHKGPGRTIVFRMECLEEGRAERVARALGRLRGVTRVAYRNSDGKGGLFGAEPQEPGPSSAENGVLTMIAALQRAFA